MKEFKFDESKSAKLLTLTIDGNDYSFNPMTLAVKKAVEKFVLSSRPLENTLHEKADRITQDELKQIEEKTFLLICETVNSILGMESYEKIFANRTLDYEEHQALMAYIFESITEFCRP